MQARLVAAVCFALLAYTAVATSRVQVFLYPFSLFGFLDFLYSLFEGLALKAGVLCGSFSRFVQVLCWQHSLMPGLLRCHQKVVNWRVASAIVIRETV